MIYIFVSGVFSPEEINQLPFGSIAGNKMQLGIISALAEMGEKVIVIGAESHAAFNFKNKEKLFICGRKDFIPDTKIERNLFGFINIFFIKQICSYFSYKKLLKKYIKQYKNESICILTFNTFSYRNKAILKAIRNKKNIIFLPIIADVPTGQSKSLLQRIEDKEELRLISKCDGQIVLSKYTNLDFSPAKKYIVIEGGFDADRYRILDLNYNIFDYNKINIVFSGSLNLFSGIDLIYDAFRILEKTYNNVQLHIFGKGHLSDFVNGLAIKDSNVIYHGQIDNDKMLALQQKATILVCGRVSDNFVTKYTFPSKIIEYLASGTPIICNRLLGVSNEFDNYINYPETCTPLAWFKTMKMIIDNYEYYKKKAIIGKDFIFSQKNWKIIGEKIISFVNNLKDMN